MIEEITSLWQMISLIWHYMWFLRKSGKKFHDYMESTSSVRGYLDFRMQYNDQKRPGQRKLTIRRSGRDRAGDVGEAAASVDARQR